MIINEIINSDSLNTVKDTVTAADTALGELNISFTNITSESLVITVLGYAIVFAALVILYLVFFNFAKILQKNVKKRLRAKGEIAHEDEDISVSGEINAAISAALYLHFEEAHDYENTVITIKKVQRTYSPWSSKIYGLRNYPGK